jgi:hypothetical protein
MRDTPRRMQSDTPSGSGKKTVLTLSTLVRMDGPYQDALAHDMAYVAEYPEGIQKHFVDCEEPMVMKAFQWLAIFRWTSASKRVCLLFFQVDESLCTSVSLSGAPQSLRLNLPFSANPQRLKDMVTRASTQVQSVIFV